MLLQSFRSIFLVCTFFSLSVSVQATSTGSSGLPQEQARALYKELQTLQWVESWGGWPQVQSSETLELGMVSPAVEVLRKRLELSGDLADSMPMAAGSLEVQTFDWDLLQAVLRFQTRHGLEPDGAVGGATMRALNIPVQTRIQQVELNLERWEKLERDLDGSFILVNIPEFKLRLYDNDREKLDMRVVVGNTRRQTPEMTERLEYLVVNPYWYVPKRISAYELLPKVQENPDYLSSRNYEVWRNGAPVEASEVSWSDVTPEAFDYSLRQRPGSGNSLGRVKFIMPNSSNIYLHDTPSRAHFARDRRAYSHGCVRLEEPFRLAQAVLKMKTALTDEEIEERLALDYTTRIELAEELPVHLAYLTTWSHEGVVHYFDDVYGRDERTTPKQNPAPPVQTYIADADAPLRREAEEPVAWRYVSADAP